jgi:hypothetical protein
VTVSVAPKIPTWSWADRDQSAGGGADHEAPVGEREQAVLDRVELETLAGDEQRLDGIEAWGVRHRLGGRDTHRGSLGADGTEGYRPGR